MELGATRLKLLSGVCTLVVCGGAAVLVGADPKPVAAPLTPPQHSSAASSLVIPPSCGTVSIGRPAPKPAAPQLAQLSPAAQQAVSELQGQGVTAQQRRQILAGLSAKDRQMVTAYLRKNGRSGSGSCPPGGSQGSGGGTISASQGSGGPVTPLTNSYVS